MEAEMVAEDGIELNYYRFFVSIPFKMFQKRLRTIQSGSAEYIARGMWLCDYLLAIPHTDTMMSILAGRIWWLRTGRHGEWRMKGF